jgi:hypothetical protein
LLAEGEGAKAGPSPRSDIVFAQEFIEKLSDVVTSTLIFLSPPFVCGAFMYGLKPAALKKTWSARVFQQAP